MTSEKKIASNRRHYEKRRADLVKERERSRAASARWRAANPEKAREICRKSRAKYKDVYKAKYSARQSQYQKTYRASLTPDEKRDRDLRKKYGITLEYYNAMWSAQAGCCPICALSLEGRAPGVDHAHDTKRVREILCSRCNHAVGSLHESPAAAERLAAYLRKHGRK